MRILFLSNFYPPLEIGGYEQWCHEVAGGLECRGHKVTVITSRHGLPVSGPPREQAVRRVLHLQSDLNYYSPGDFFLKRRRQEQENLTALERAIEETKSEIIMVWGMWNLSHELPLLCEARMPGRVAYFISNYWPSDNNPHAAYWRDPARRKATELVKNGFRRIALGQLEKGGYPPRLHLENAVCCSQYVRSRLIADGKLPESAGVLLGGTDPVPFLAQSALKREDDGTLHLIYFGRLIHDKGVHTAIEALGRLKKLGAVGRIRLTVLGSGHPEYEAQLRHMATDLGLEDRVTFVRQVPRGEIPKWLGKADVFLFPSIWPEPMARSVMEAMAAGLLVIGTRVGGQTEMLRDGDNALTFEPEDTAALARLIREAEADPERRRALARAGQSMVLEKFTLDRMVADIEGLLQDVLTRRSPDAVPFP